MTIIVGVDGSDSSTRAVEWCAAHAAALDGDVVVVHAIELPVYAMGAFSSVALPLAAEPDHDKIEHEIETEWCVALGDAGVAYRVVLIDGPSASSIIAVADREKADLVVTGRRGRGGFAELLLGSTSHQLSQHVHRPLLIVP